MRRAGTPGRGVRGAEAGAAGVGAATGVRAEEEVFFGVRSVGGVAPGFFKENQDDAFVARKKFAHNSPGSHKDFFAAVMDGHGLAGKHVSGFVKSQLTQDEVQQRLLSEPTEDTLTWAFHKTASEIKRSGIDCRESGSTTVSCLRRGDSLLVANVGDSRCVMGREEGGMLKAKDLSMDHKPERQTEYERITRSNGFVEPSRAFGGRYVGPARVWAVKQQVGGLAVSRAIGDTNLNSVGVIPTPEVIKEQVGANDKFVILASDGVWEHLSSQDAVSAVKQCWQDPKRASEVIVNRAREAWGRERSGYRDDITAVVIKL